jgi:hypothetical protein
MDREFYEIGSIEPSDYGNDVWSSGEFKQHCSPHMGIVDDLDVSDVDAWGTE